VITFRLRRAAVVRFRIRQEAPRCVVVGSLTVRGHAGRNRLQFAGRYRGVALPPGTYTLTGHAFRNGRVTPLGAATVVIVAEGETETRPQRTTCSSPGDGVDPAAAAALLADSQARGGSGSGDGAGGTASDDNEGVAASVERTANEGRDRRSSQAAGAGNDDEGTGQPLLGVPNPFDEAPTWVQPLLLVALAAAILMLLLAALPATAVRPATAAPVVVRRRTEFALVGAAILGVVAVAALVV
jgi:hypothetical protein